MGIGKTAVSQQLKKALRNSVFLDGDWCWDAAPLQVTEETKAMVRRNICQPPHWTQADAGSSKALGWLISRPYGIGYLLMSHKGFVPPMLLTEAWQESICIRRWTP